MHSPLSPQAKIVKEAQSPVPIILSNLKNEGSPNPQDNTFSSAGSPDPPQVSNFNNIASPAPAKLQVFDPQKKPFSPKKVNNLAEVKSPRSPKVNNFFNKRNWDSEEVKIDVGSPQKAQQA